MCAVKDCFKPVIEPENKSGVPADGSNPNSIHPIQGIYCAHCAVDVVERLEI